MPELLSVDEFKNRKLLKEGCWFKMRLDIEASCTLESQVTGVEEIQTITNQEEEKHLFRYTKHIGCDKDITLVGQPSTILLSLRGETGYRNGEEVIKTFCETKFGRPGEVEARSITSEEQNKLTEGFRYGQYWLPETYNVQYRGIIILGLAYWEAGIKEKSFLALDDESYTRTRSVRPVISLFGTNVRILVDKEHSGKEADKPYEIVFLNEKQKTSKVKKKSERTELITTEEFSSRGLLREGEWFKVSLNPDGKVKLEKNETGYSKVQELENKNGETWLFRYTADINDGGDIKLLGEPSDCTLFLGGRKGHELGRLAIKSFCEAKYSIPGQIDACSIVWKEQVSLAPEFQYGEYWLPKRYKKDQILGMQCVSGERILSVYLYRERTEGGKRKNESGSDCNSVRPVILLKGEQIRIRVGEKRDGKTAESAYEIVIEK